MDLSTRDRLDRPQLPSENGSGGDLAAPHTVSAGAGAGGVCHVCNRVS